MTVAEICLSLFVIALCLIVLKMWFTGKHDSNDNPGDNDKEKLGL